MGSRIASRLLDAGYQLAVYNRTAQKAQALGERGARVYDSSRQLVADSDVVLSMLSDDAAVEQVMLGPDGIVAASRPGTTIIDLSSVHPRTCRRLADAGRAKEVAVLDAAVSGSTPQAQAGALVIFVGGERAIYERVRPLFDVLAQHTFYLGPNGAGATMKLVVNSLLGVGMQALAEAVTLGERSGLDREVMLDTLQQTAVLTPGQKLKLENVRADAYPVQFPLRLMWKDFGNILQLAEQESVPMPVTAAAQQAFAIEQAKHAEEDFSAVIRAREDLAGAR